MKRALLVMGIVVLMGSQPVYADDSVKHTAHGIFKTTVGVIHSILHVAETIVDYAMAPAHSILGALGADVPAHTD